MISRMGLDRCGGQIHNLNLGQVLKNISVCVFCVFGQADERCWRCQSHNFPGRICDPMAPMGQSFEKGSPEADMIVKACVCYQNPVMSLGRQNPNSRPRRQTPFRLMSRIISLIWVMRKNVAYMVPILWLMNCGCTIS